MASEGTFVQPSIPRFDGQYEHWSMLMENFLRSKEYWQAIEYGVETPDNIIALTNVQQQELQTMKLKDLKPIITWRRQQLQALRSEFETIRMKPDEPVSDYFSRVMAIVNKMRIHGDKTEDVTVVEKILRSLTMKFNFVVCAIEESKDVDELSLDELQSSLMVHEQKQEKKDRREKEKESRRIEQEFGTWTQRFYVLGKGEATVVTEHNVTHNMSSVLYVLDLKTNLLSIGQLQEKGHEISIKKGVCKILHDEFGIGYGLKTLQQKAMVAGLPHFSSSSYVCEEYTLSKQHREPFPKGKTQRARKLLEIVHSDICRPIDPTSNGVPKNFRPEAVNWSIRILNRSPTFAVQNMTPEEAWSGKKPIRDVIFDEDNVWQWDKPHTQQQVPTDLDGDSSHHHDEYFVQPQVVESTAIEESAIPIRDTRSSRVRRRPAWMNDFEVTGVEQLEDPLVHFVLFADCDPVVFEEAVKEPKWQKAMDEEIVAIERNKTWELVDLPKGQKVIDVKVSTKLKRNGEVDKYKACLVAKGYKQVYGVDYKEVFSPVARHDTIRLVIALAAQNSWPIFHLDVKSAFLHGELKEQVFVSQPPGYVKDIHKVYKLNKALYGLKQAPRAWYGRIEAYFTEQGFRKCPYKYSLFVKVEDRWRILMVCLYVDDLLFTGNDTVMFEKFKKSVMAEFDMSDLGRLHYFLGIEVVQSDAGIFISQRKYMQEILKKFRMKDCNPVSTPVEPGVKLVKDENGRDVDSTLYKQIVGSLMYLTATRPDIMYAVNLVCRGEDSELIGFTDSDYAGVLDDGKRTSGYAFMIGSGAISWSSRKQPIVTLSTTEAELVAATACGCQAIWLRYILEELNFSQGEPIIIFCDNNSSIKLSRDRVLHGRSKHISVRCHFLRDRTRSQSCLVYVE
ncbi:retrovirus-related pol polyprotein from transposon TNT 1-94 [Tanacetum coccineum]